MTAQPLLDVNDLTVEFATRRGIVKAVQHVNISVAKGETLGIVGKSGSGKSVTSYAVMRILDRAGKIAEGSVMFSGIDVKAATRRPDARSARPRNLDDLPESARGAQSDPQGRRPDRGRAAPARAESTTSDRGEKAIEALEQVKIARPRERYHAYPFELSGGMCQRVVIALALACNPQLLIADEPTTGLDVTTQKAVMDLIVELTKRRGMSTILITHDLGLAAAYCDRVVVMEKGRVVETALSADIFAKPAARLYQEADARDAAARRLLARSVAGGGSGGASVLPRPPVVMAGHSRPEDGVASARLRPAIHQSLQDASTKAMDPRVKPGGDENEQSPCFSSKNSSRNIRARAPPRR